MHHLLTGTLRLLKAKLEPQGGRKMLSLASYDIQSCAQTVQSSSASLIPTGLSEASVK